MSETTQAKVCPKCGAMIPAEAPQGLCPTCLLRQASVATEYDDTEPSRATPPAREEVAAAFPQLEILELIGQGGMGFVFKARQPNLDRLVALKILPRTLAGEPAFAERFAREGRMLARLNHPNIVTIHDFGQANGLFYLLMEFVDGLNLRQAMRLGHFTPAQALAVVPKICEALQFAHNEGILHRDIKPENILLDSKGRVKIADFGIAKLVGLGTQILTSFGEPVPEAVRAPSPLTLTETGKTLGTPHYMAPEQLEHPEDVDQRADIYSLGVVFYELLTGELPIGRFAPPSEKSKADARVDEVVLRALQKERELRQRSAEELKTQVETITAEGGTRRGPGRPVRPPERLSPRAHVIRAASAVLTVFFLATFAATLVTFLMPESYRASTRLALHPVQPQPAGWFDPYQLQSQLETVRSTAILEPVVKRLHLQSTWAQRFALSNLTLTATVQLLERQLEVRPLRNTMMFEIDTFSERPGEAAELANAIAREYSAFCSERIRAAQAAGQSALLTQLVRPESLDPAVPPLRPSRPNKPLNIALGMLGGLVLGLFVGFAVGLLSVWRDRANNPAATGSLAPKPDRFWRWFAIVVLAIITLPLGLATLAILAGLAVPNLLNRWDHTRPPLETPAAVNPPETPPAAYLSLEKLQFTVAHPEPEELDWGFKVFLPPGHLASFVFVRWTNGVPTIDPGFSAYYKVGAATGIDISACTLSCYPIFQSQLSTMTNGEGRRELADWGIPESHFANLTNVVQWNVNLGLGYTASRWWEIPPGVDLGLGFTSPSLHSMPYRATGVTLPLTIRAGHQGAFPLVDFNAADERERGRYGMELRILLQPFEGTPVRMLPNESDHTNYVAGSGLAATLEQTLRDIQTFPLDP